jgi:hypothetical protein
MNNESELVKKYRSIAERILKNEISSDLKYHTIDHTRSVVSVFYAIGLASNLSEKDLELGSISAWFHDTGYSRGTIDHENSSIEIFNENLTQGDFSDKETEIIQILIQCTKMPQKPTTTLEKCLCDADLHHLGAKDFFEKSNLLRKETEKKSGISISKESWNRESYYFLKEHSYFTPYAMEHYNAQKEANMDELRSNVKEFAKQDKHIKNLESKMEKLNEKLLQKPSRGIETMFRTTSRNHLQLSAMADSKANIMISINTIVISVVLSASAGRMADFPNLVLPVTVLSLVCLTTIVLSVLATRPQVSEGKFTREDILNKKTNLLFFGNFHGMDIEDYQWGVSEMMKNADYLYSSLTRDVFFLGKVLGKNIVYYVMHTQHL